MILNSGRHTQPDPQSCRVRSLGRRRGGTQKQTTHQGTKTKLNSATPNRDKTIHSQRKHRKSIPPTMSQRNQHLTHAMLRKPATTTPKQFQTTWCFGKDWRHAGGAMRPSISNRVPRNPAIPLHLQKYCFLVKLRHFSQKRSLQQPHFRGRKHIDFFGLQEVVLPSTLG